MPYSLKYITVVDVWNCLLNLLICNSQSVRQIDGSDRPNIFLILLAVMLTVTTKHKTSFYVLILSFTSKIAKISNKNVLFQNTLSYILQSVVEPRSIRLASCIGNMGKLKTQNVKFNRTYQYLHDFMLSVRIVVVLKALRFG